MNGKLAKEIRKTAKAMGMDYKTLKKSVKEVKRNGKGVKK